MKPVRIVKRRGPAFDARAACPFCSTSLGVRAIRPGQRLLAEHSPGRARIWPGEPRCDGSAFNTSDGPAVHLLPAGRGGGRAGAHPLALDPAAAPAAPTRS